MSRIRVVIVAYRSAVDLSRCLPTLANEPDLEVIVVDNSADGETRRLLSSDFPFAQYLDAQGNLGFARANNLGAKGFTGDHICFLNPDTEVDAGALGKLADFLDAHPRAGAAGPFVANPDGSRQMSYRSWPGFLTPLFHRYSLITKLFPNNPWSRKYLQSDHSGDEACTPDWLSACGVLVRRTAFEEVGGFDERYFMFCEDTALCRALYLHNWERWYVPDARIVHYIGKSIGERSVKLVWQRHRSMWIYFTTYTKAWILWSPFVLAALAARFSLYALRALLASTQKQQ